MGLGALLVLLCLAAPAQADIVLHDGGVRKDADAARRVQNRSGSPPKLVLSSDILAGPSRLLTANTSLERCEGEPIPLDVTDKLSQVEERLLSFDLRGAARILGVLDTLLPCSASIVTDDILSRTAFLKGSTLLDMESEEAHVPMKEALSFNIDYAGEKGFPRTHLELLETARREVKATPRGRLFVWLGPGMREVAIDGTLYGDVSSLGVPLYPGLHLMQVQTEQGLRGAWIRTYGTHSTIIFPGSGRGIWADLGESPGGERAMSLMLIDEFRGRQGDIHVIHYRGRQVLGATWPGDGGARVPWRKPKGSKTPNKGPRDGGVAEANKGSPSKGSGGTSQSEAGTKDAGQAGAGALGDEDPRKDVEDTEATGEPDRLAGQEMEDEDEDDSDLLATEFDIEAEGTGDPADGRRKQTEAEVSTWGLKFEGRMRRFRLAIGGGFHYAQPFPYGLLAVDFSIRVGGPMIVSAFVRPSFGGVYSFPVPDGVAPVMGPVVLFPFGAGAGIQKPGAFAPYVSLIFQFAYNRDGLSQPEYLPGIALQGGMDYSPKDGPFLIRLQGEAGILGTELSVRVWGGAGVRF